MDEGQYVILHVFWVALHREKGVRIFNNDHLLNLSLESTDSKDVLNYAHLYILINSSKLTINNFRALNKLIEHELDLSPLMHAI